MRLRHGGGADGTSYQPTVAIGIGDYVIAIPWWLEALEDLRLKWPKPREDFVQDQVQVEGSFRWNPPLRNGFPWRKVLAVRINHTLMQKLRSTCIALALLREERDPAPTRGHIDTMLYFIG